MFFLCASLLSLAHEHWEGLSPIIVFELFFFFCKIDFAGLFWYSFVTNFVTTHACIVLPFDLKREYIYVIFGFQTGGRSFNRSSTLLNSLHPFHYLPCISLNVGFANVKDASGLAYIVLCLTTLFYKI